MLDFQDRPIGQLSSCQQQGVFLARALAQQSELITHIQLGAFSVGARSQARSTYQID